MKSFSLVFSFFFVTVILLGRTAAFTGKNRLESKKVWVPFSLLAPTQMSIGRFAMLEKVRKMRKKVSSGKLKGYLLKKAAPAFAASDGRFYITDRHHTSRAALELFRQAQSSIDSFPLEINEEYKELPMARFLSVLKSRGLLYLSLRGETQSISELPRDLLDLEDDAYRSLSWMIREEGCFKKVDVAYLEFIWADFLRTRVHLDSGSALDLTKAMPDALDLCDSQTAAHLPGHI